MVRGVLEAHPFGVTKVIVNPLNLLKYLMKVASIFLIQRPFMVSDIQKN